MKFSVSFLLLMLSLNAFSATLTNRLTGESVNFEIIDVGNNRKVVRIDATNAGENIRSVELQEHKRSTREKILAKNASNPLMLVTSELIDSTDYNLDINNSEATAMLLFLTPPFVVAGYVAAAVDVIALPIRLPMRISNELRKNRDLQVVAKVIFVGDDLTVSNKRFNRILSYLR